MRQSSSGLWAVVVLVIIVLLGGFLRLHDLGAESLWNDELESWRQSNYDSVEQVVQEGVLPDTHPPAFQVVLYVVENTIGSTEAALRLPSAISGILTIIVVFLIGRSFLAVDEALMAALFMAVMWAPVSYSQEARNYALVMLAAAVAGYFWIDLVREVEEGRRIGIGPVLGYVAAGATCLYTHYFGLLLVALQAVFLVGLALARGRFRPHILRAYGLMALLYAPWVPYMIEQSSHTSRIAWIQTPTITAFPALISFAFNRLTWLALVVIALYLWLLWSMVARVWRSGWRRTLSLSTSPEGLLLYWLAAPTVAAFVISVLWTPIFTQRNLLICLPAVYLLLARAIGRLPVPRLGQGIVALAVAGIAIFNLMFSVGYYRTPQKEQFREVVRYVVENYPETHDPPIIGYSRFPEYFDYYFERLGSDLRVDLSAGENEDVARLNEFLRKRSSPRIWFISAHRPPDDGFMQAFLEEYVVLDQRSFFMAEALLLGKEN